jgi:hypothetical protein
MDYKDLLSVGLLIVLLLTGCRSADHVAYHSTADIPYYTDDTATRMELIVGDQEAAQNREYVVFAAVDDGEIPYVLLAPYSGSSASTEYSFEKAVIERAVPLHGDNLDRLITGLGTTLRLWDKDNGDGEGDFYEYVHAPEQDINRLSENVVEWHSAIRFTASHTPEGPSAQMLLGDSPKEALQYLVEFEERSAVDDLHDVLQEARERSNAMSTQQQASTSR